MVYDTRALKISFFLHHFFTEIGVQFAEGRSGCGGWASLKAGKVSLQTAKEAQYGARSDVGNRAHHGAYGGVVSSHRHPGSPPLPPRSVGRRLVRSRGAPALHSVPLV